MKLTLAALLLLLILAFAAMEMTFLAFCVIVILVLLAFIDTGGRPQELVLAPEYASPAAGKPSKTGLVKTTIVTKDGGTKKKVTTWSTAEEAGWQAPGQPKNFGKTSYEQFGSGVGQLVWGIAEGAFHAGRWIFGMKGKK